MEGHREVTKINKLLKDLSNTNSRNSKLEILKKLLLKDKIARSVVKLACDPFVTFGVQPDTTQPEPNEKYDKVFTKEWPTVKQQLLKLANREVTGNEARNLVHKLFSNIALSPVVWRVLKKDLRCGVDKTINKAYPGLLPEFSVALAVDAPDKIRYPVWAEPKYDGVRTITIIDRHGNVNMYSRNGRPYNNFPNIKVSIEELCLKNVVLDGEVMGATFDTVMNIAHRKRGLADSYLRYMVFDCIKLKNFKKSIDNTKRSIRRKRLKIKLRGSDKSYVYITPGKMVNNEEEMKKYFNKKIKQGYEGLVVKSNSPYSFKRSTAWIKVKEMATADCRIVGFEEGKGKYKGVLGALIVKYNKVKIKVGSGYGDALRKEIWDNKRKWKGAMVEIQYQEITKDGSFRFPVFLRGREDKED